MEVYCCKGFKTTHRANARFINMVLLSLPVDKTSFALLRWFSCETRKRTNAGTSVASKGASEHLVCVIGACVPNKNGMSQIILTMEVEVCSGVGSRNAYNDWAIWCKKRFVLHAWSGQSWWLFRITISVVILLWTGSEAYHRLPMVNNKRIHCPQNAVKVDVTSCERHYSSKIPHMMLFNSKAK